MSTEPTLETLQSSGTHVADDEIGRAIAARAPWFHNLHLPSGHQTAPDHPLGDFPAFKWAQVQRSLPRSLEGWSVLDIGCNAGFYSFQLADRGADVLGVDHDEHYLEQARWAHDLIRPRGRVRFERLGVYDLIELEARFDLVLFLGVLYHLRYPLLALDIVATKVAKLLLVQTLSMPGEGSLPTPPDLAIDERDVMLDPTWPKMAFIEHKLAGDHTNWWAPNDAAMRAMIRTTGLRVIEAPAHEFYLCEPSGEASLARDELTAVMARRGGRG